MTPSETLSAQAIQLLDHVQQEQARLSAMLYPGPGGAGRNGFPPIVLNNLRDQLDTQSKKLNNLIAAVSCSSELTSERRNYQRIDKTCHDLFGECLAISIGKAIREQALDANALEIVEHLLAQLGEALQVPWPHVATLAEAEFFATASQVIRIRFPACTVWDVPVAAHEFGHFVGPRLRSFNGELTPYQSFRMVKDIVQPEHLEEYFADTIAVFTLGPAYVHSCLLHRFDPAGEDGVTHPSDNKRAHWILFVLEYIASKCEPLQKSMLCEDIEKRKEDWQNAVAANGGLPLTAETEKALRRRARDLCCKLYSSFPGAAFSNMQPTLELVAEFGKNPPPHTGLEVRNVLNAAWIVRLQSERTLSRGGPAIQTGLTPGEIDQWAKQVCLKAMRRSTFSRFDASRPNEI
jgi:hypothetical protein